MKIGVIVSGIGPGLGQELAYGAAREGAKLVIAARSTELLNKLPLDRTMYGSDQAASIEESGMKNLISSIKKVQLALGKESLGQILDDEIPIAKKLRAHIKI